MRFSLYLLALAVVFGPSVEAQTVSVRGGATLAVQNGADLDIHGSTLDLGDETETSVLAEAGGGRVVGGTLTATRSINAPAALDVAGIGVVVTSAADLGVTTVTRALSAPAIGGFAGLAQTVGFAAATPMGASVTLAYTYDDDALNGLTEADLTFYVSTDGGTSWSQADGTLDAGANAVTIATTDAASTWALGEGMVSAATLVVEAEGWRMLATPAPATFGSFLGDLWTQGYPGSDVPTGACTAFTFDESAGSFETGWACLPEAASAFGLGAGVMAFVYEDDDASTPGVVDGGFPKTLSMIGAVTEPPYNAFPLSYTDGETTPSYAEGWNLLGNPFRSAFDWDAVSLGGGLTQTVYVYDPDYLGGDYRTWTQGLGGDLTDGLVPAFQGFFAKAVAADPALTVPEAALATDTGVYGRTASEPTALRFELALGDGEAARPVSAAFVALADGAERGLDRLDAVRLTPTAWPRTVLSTVALDDEESALALNALPADRGPLDVPLSVVAEGHEVGDLALTLSWDGALPDGWAAVLVDGETGVETPVVDGGAYTFHLAVPEAGGSRTVRSSGLGLDLAPPTASAARTGTTTLASTGERFVLRLTPAATSTEAAPTVLALGAPSPNPTRGGASIRYETPEAGPVRLAVYDALGREVAVLADTPVAAGRHLARLGAGVLAPGVYVVRLSTATATAVRTLTIVR